MFQSLIKLIREQYRSNESIPLHAPLFLGLEREYVMDSINSTFVSSVGPYVDRFELSIASYTGCSRAVATMNGTSALHVALKLVGVEQNNLVITQPLTFVATCNAISYCGAEPIFIDVEPNTLSLSPIAMDEWLEDNAFIDDDRLCRTRSDLRIIRACLPMHTFGHPSDLDGLIDVCKRWHLALVEDAAESLGSFYKGRHTGTIGNIGTLSFNGNKIVTTGGGGMILANKTIGERAKYLTTTAKQPHLYEYVHDEVGYNYRMPNLNAALGCAQIEQIEEIIRNKRELASRYASFFRGSSLQFINEPRNCRSNYWLNAVICENREIRDLLLKSTNDAGVMTRPIWALMSSLKMYSHCLRGTLTQAEWFESRVVNLPSSVIPKL